MILDKVSLVVGTPVLIENIEEVFSLLDKEGRFTAKTEHKLMILIIKYLAEQEVKNDV